MATRMLNFRLDEEIVDAIGSAAAHLGQSKTEFARRAFRDAIARTWSDGPNTSQTGSGTANGSTRSSSDRVERPQDKREVAGSSPASGSAQPAKPWRRGNSAYDAKVAAFKKAGDSDLMAELKTDALKPKGT